jgi:hypothetical protein
MNKWDRWYDSLPAHTKKYLEKQPVWHDRDIFKAAVVGFIIGLILGLTF